MRTSHKSIAFFLACGLIAFAVIQSTYHASASNTHEVYPGDSIQGAINSASEGDTILIKNGTYRQYLIIVNKTVTILGESQEGTIVDGERAVDAPVIFNVIADDVRIVNLTIQNATEGFGGLGVGLAHVQGAEVSACTIRNAGTGIRLLDSNSCKIEMNRITHNEKEGIKLDINSSGNFVIDNLVADNPIGILSEMGSGRNTIDHNNFVGNSLHITGFGSGNNKWDNGYPSGGNYWSGYSGGDSFSGIGQNLTGSDGIGDKPYPNSTIAYDNYPFMGPIHMFWAGKWGIDHYVWIACNSTSEIVGFKFDNASIPYLQFNATGYWLPTYWCRVMVPRQLMWVDSLAEWQVLVNHTIATPLVDYDADCTYFYLNYTYGMFETNKSIQINGTHTIPETTWPLLIAMLILLTAQVALMKRGLRRRIHAEIL